MEPKVNLLEELMLVSNNIDTNSVPVIARNQNVVMATRGLLMRLHKLFNGKSDRETISVKTVMKLLRAGGLPVRYRNEIDATLSQVDLIAKYTDRINPQASAYNAEHPTYTQTEWSKSVSHGVTLLGYWNWVQESLKGK